MEKIVEVCCGSYFDALAAYKGGAKRIELNSALNLGGLTPSLGSLLLIKRNAPELKVIAMDRPRGGGFNYSEEDFLQMREDCKLLLENGADGIAFGCLNHDKTLNELQIKEMVNIIKQYHKEAVFHRAFDCMQDQSAALKRLIELGIDRVLTSGGADKTMNGLEAIASLQKQYGNQIEILAGGGVNYTNALTIINKTGISQVHSSCKAWLTDFTTTGNQVSYAYASEDPNSYEIVDENLVRKLVNSI